MGMNNSFISNYTFWCLILGLLLIFTLFLPFRIEEIEKDYTAGWFRGSSFQSSIKRIIGFALQVAIIPIAFYLITFFIVFFSKKRVGKIFALISTFFYLLSLLLVLFAANFNLYFGTKEREVYTGFGYYLMVLFSLIFIVLVIVQIKRTWNDNLDLHKKELDLLDVDLTD